MCILLVDRDVEQHVDSHWDQRHQTLEICPYRLSVLSARRLKNDPALLVQRCDLEQRKYVERDWNREVSEHVWEEPT